VYNYLFVLFIVKVLCHDNVSVTVSHTTTRQ